MLHPEGIDFQGKKEKKVLEDYKKDYDPTMETLREEKRRLHEAAIKYIIEKNNFEKKIKSFEADLDDHHHKLKESEQHNCGISNEH